MSSLNVQMGGDHYKCLPYQPVQFSIDMCLNFVQGNIVKYISRYKNKNGDEDLFKAHHYATIGKELRPINFAPAYKISGCVGEFIYKNDLNPDIRDILEATCNQDWDVVAKGILKLIHENY